MSRERGEERGPSPARLVLGCHLLELGQELGLGQRLVVLAQGHAVLPADAGGDGRVDQGVEGREAGDLGSSGTGARELLRSDGNASDGKGDRDKNRAAQSREEGPAEDLVGGAQHLEHLLDVGVAQRVVARLEDVAGLEGLDADAPGHHGASEDLLDTQGGEAGRGKGRGAYRPADGDRYVLLACNMCLEGLSRACAARAGRNQAVRMYRAGTLSHRRRRRKGRGSPGTNQTDTIPTTTRLQRLTQSYERHPIPICGRAVAGFGRRRV